MKIWKHCQSASLRLLKWSKSSSVHIFDLPWLDLQISESKTIKNVFHRFHGKTCNTYFYLLHSPLCLCPTFLDIAHASYKNKPLHTTLTRTHSHTFLSLSHSLSVLSTLWRSIIFHVSLTPSHIHCLSLPCTHTNTPTPTLTLTHTHTYSHNQLRKDS